MKKTAILAAILFGCILLSCCIGRYYLSPMDIISIISDNHTSPMDTNVFLNIRLPRTIVVVISGGALALSGFVYQSLFRNPLVSPDVLGVSSGASVGAIIGILFFRQNPILIQTLSFVLGILVVLLSIALAHAMGGKRLYTLILSGIIVGSLANAVIMVFKYTADPNRHLSAIEYWLMGSFNTVLWKDLYLLLPLCFIASTILFLLKHQLRALSLGDEEAQSLGVNVKIISTISIIASTILVTSVVSIAGVVSWIGLIVPHITRFFSEENYMHNFNQSILLGGILLLSADTLARNLFSAEIPISILTSLMGAIFLLIFLRLKNRG